MLFFKKEKEKEKKRKGLPYQRKDVR